MRSAPTPLNRARWAGVPAEDRRSGRRAALVGAAFELLADEGWSATTVRRVCAQARLNPRYFYESFAELDDLVVAVYDQVVAELFEHIRAARAGAGRSMRAQLRATVEATAAFVDDDRRRGRVLYVAALGNEALNRRRRETGDALVESLGRAGRGDPPAARVRAAVLVGGFTELLVAWLDGRIDLTRAEFVEHATAVFSRLAAPARARGAVRSGVEGRP